MASHFGMIVAHYHHSADDLFALKESVGCNFCLLQGDFTTESDTMRVMEEASACCDGFTHILDFEYNGAPCDCILEAP